MRTFKYLIILALVFQTWTTQAEIINKIVVTVGDNIITQYDVESFNKEKIKQIYQIENEDRRTTVLNEYTRTVTDILVKQSILEIAAGRAGVKVTDEDAEKALENILEQNGITREQLEVLLIKDNLTLPQYLVSIKKDIFKARLKSRIITPMIVITQEDINNKIDEVAEVKKLDNQLELRMITLDETTTFKEVETYLKDHSFTDAAVKYSKDGTAKQAGYLGWLKISGMAPMLQEAAQGKGFGDIFTAVNEDGKKMMFKVEGVRDKYDIDSELRVELVKQLQEERFEETFNSWLKKSTETIYIDYVN